MNKALPPIKETEAELRSLFRQEKNNQKYNRLHALYLIVSGQARSRGKVADLLGKNRNAIAKWLALYESGGLEKLLDIYRPPGAKSKITEEALADIKEILASPQGRRTYKAIHQMVKDKHKIDIHYSNVHHLVRYKLGAKAKVPRPSHPKKTKVRLRRLEPVLGGDSKS